MLVRYELNIFVWCFVLFFVGVLVVVVLFTLCDKQTQVDNERRKMTSELLIQ